MEPLSEKRYLELHAPAGGDFLAARERLLAALPDGSRQPPSGSEMMGFKLKV